MKVLVTGGCGFIGSHIVDTLVARGDSVSVIDAECADNDIFYKNPKAYYTKANILDVEVVSELCKKTEVVFHLAAESRIGPAIEDPRKACETNVVGTCTVLKAALDAKSSVVYSSTSACYGLKNIPPLHEEMPQDNLNGYSTSKLAGEDLCKMFSKLYGLPTISLRYFNVFGERMPSRGQYAPVLGIFLRQAVAGQALTVVGDGEQRRDFVHVSDIVQANIKASAKIKQFSGSVFNVGSGKNISVLEIAKAFNREIKFLPAREGEARTTLANISKISRDLAYAPNVDVMEWLRKEIKQQGLM